ncbi:MAG TPA: hypothetical protein VK722_14085, partial [Candidatus Aquilonibacter sp.]|nr:hypothetical protein [Candidatus Aquilonibacter sp.]
MSPFSYLLTYRLAGTDSCAGYFYWDVIDPEGSTHPLDIVTHTPGSNCNGNIPAGPTKDGSGMWVNTSTTPATLILKDGTTIVPSSGAQTLQDTNGNMASLSSDMLDRSQLTVSSVGTTTYTSPSGQTISGPQYTLWTYKDSNGLQQQFRFDYEAVDLYYLESDPIPNPPIYFQNAYLAVAKLTLPTGGAYEFSYVQKGMGQLQQITLPTGGTILYGYNLGSGSGAISCWHPAYVDTDPDPSLTCRAEVASRTVSANGVTGQWTYSNVAPGGYGGTAVITDPVGNDEAHTFQALVQLAGYVSTAVETQVQRYSGCSPANPNCTTSGTVLRTVATTYAYDSSPIYFGGLADMRPIQVTTTLDNGEVTETQTDYETFTDPAGETASRLNITAFREYDYSTGTPPLLRQTKYSYLHQSNPVYATLNIVNRVTLKTIYNGGGTQVAQTTYEYDNYSHANQPMVASDAVQHNATFNAGYTTRGNETAVSQWNNANGALLTATNQYDDAGNILSNIDPNGNKTSFSFTDAWGNSTCAPSGQGKAYVTAITNALNQITSETYDSCTGVLASSTDANHQKTSNSYDMMSRLTLVSYPDGGSTGYCYSDVGGSACSQSGPPYQVVTTKAISSSQSEVSTTLYDGLGRISQTQLNSDPSGADYTQTTTYDALGRISQVYNPTRCNPPTTDCGETTWGYSTYGYDALGRTTQVAHSDGTSAAMSYIGRATIASDEGNGTAPVQRISQVDGLGRVASVCEVANSSSSSQLGPGGAPIACQQDISGTGFLTTYSYDTLDNLLTVNEGSLSQRSFVYDSLSRLLCAANPETSGSAACPNPDNGVYTAGTTRYSYDADGNMSSRVRPAPTQTSPSTTDTTAFTYDALNRLTQKTYSDSVTPTV